MIRYSHEADPEGLAATLFAERYAAGQWRYHPDFPNQKDRRWPSSEYRFCAKVWKSDIEESESEDEEETKNPAEIKDSEEEEEQEKGKQDKEEEVPRLDGIETRIWSSN